MKFHISQVAAVPEDVGTAGALRAIGHHLTAHDILVGVLTFPGMSFFDNLLPLIYYAFVLIKKYIYIFAFVGCEW